MMIFESNNIVVGSCLAAMSFALSHNYPIFFTVPNVPFRFDFLTSGLEPQLIPATEKTFNTFGESLIVGTKKQLLWDRLYFLLSINGKIPLSNLCTNIRYDGKTLVCSNDYSKILEIKFETCHYFGDQLSDGLIIKNSIDEDSYICYDYIAFNSGGKHEIDYISTDDDFVSEVWFYSSDRIDGNTPVRDACTVSKLTETQLLDFDYSETMARFKVLKIMKDNGMRGKQSGYTKKGTPRHYDFRTTSIRRETRRFPGRLTPAYNNIKIEKASEENMLELLSDVPDATSRLLEILDVSSP